MNRLSQKKSPRRPRPYRQPRKPPSRGRAPDPPAFASCALLGCLLIAFVIMAVSLAGMTIIKSQFTAWLEPIKDFFGFGPREIILTQPSIDEIRLMGRLDTVDLSLSAVVTVEQDHMIGSEKLVYGVCGRIVAGINLERLANKDMIVNGTTITITLPQAEIFSVDPTLAWNVADTKEYSVGQKDAQILPMCNHTYSWDTPPLLDKTPDFVREAKEQAMVQFEKIASEYVLEHAQSNAEGEMARFLLLLGYDKVVVTP